MALSLLLTQQIRKTLQGGTMKKFFALLENLWVAVAFAEAGEYESLREAPDTFRHRSDIRIHAV